MKNLIILLMLASSAFPQEPMKIKLLVPNDDWGKVCHAITRMMGPPIMHTSTSREARSSLYSCRSKLTFAYFLNNHHGDGIVAVTRKVLSNDNKALAESQPGRFYLPAYLASKGARNCVFQLFEFGLNLRRCTPKILLRQCRKQLGMSLVIDAIFSRPLL
jgi:hypothetical protein